MGWGVMKSGVCCGSFMPACILARLVPAEGGETAASSSLAAALSRAKVSAVLLCLAAVCWGVVDSACAECWLTKCMCLCCPAPLATLQNINWVNPLRRNVFTLAALINTGSLWLYEGPNANAPAPLLVARLVNRGMNCEIQTPDVKLTQPQSDPAAGLSSCQKLDGGAMRPPGVWDGAVSGVGQARQDMHV